MKYPLCNICKKDRCDYDPDVHPDHESGFCAGFNPVLKLCPFCGGDGLLHYYNRGYHIICYQCNAHSGQYATIEQAVNGWNERTRPSPKELVSELREFNNVTVLDLTYQEVCINWDMYYGPMTIIVIPEETLSINPDEDNNS
jgi:hypothetical protein